MSEPLNWRIPLEAKDWQCGWESSRRFQLNYWASLPLRAKLEAIEEMGKLSERFSSRMKKSVPDTDHLG